MKHIAIGLLSVAALAFYACGGDDSTNTVGPTAEAGAAATISVSPNPAAIRAGDSKQLKAEVTLADGSKADVSSDATTVWTSDNPQTATVDAKGNIVGVSGGATHVNVTFGGATTSVLVTVVP
jgi:uncharacterized protein YjdB